MHSKAYNISLKWNLYLTSFACRGPVNLSTPTFGNINLTERMTNLIVAWKFNKKKSARVSTCTLNTLKQHSNQIHIWCQFLAVAQLLRQPPHFQVTILKKNKFTCCFRNHRKMAAIISITALILLMKGKNHFLIWWQYQSDRNNN